MATDLTQSRQLQVGEMPVQDELYRGRLPGGEPQRSPEGADQRLLQPRRGLLAASPAEPTLFRCGQRVLRRRAEQCQAHRAVVGHLLQRALRRRPVAEGDPPDANVAPRTRLRVHDLEDRFLPLE